MFTFCASFNKILRPNIDKQYIFAVISIIRGISKWILLSRNLSSISHSYAHILVLYHSFGFLKCPIEYRRRSVYFIPALCTFASFWIYLMTWQTLSVSLSAFCDTEAVSVVSLALMKRVPPVCQALTHQCIKSGLKCFFFFYKPTLT